MISALGVGPVDVFGSSGGAVTALALATAYPGDPEGFAAKLRDVLA